MSDLIFANFVMRVPAQPQHGKRTRPALVGGHFGPQATDTKLRWYQHLYMTMSLPYHRLVQEHVLLLSEKEAPLF